MSEETRKIIQIAYDRFKGLFGIGPAIGFLQDLVLEKIMTLEEYELWLDKEDEE